MATSVLVLGATGMVGGAFIHRLLSRSDSREVLQVTAFVRSSSKAQKSLPPSVTLVEGLDIESASGLARIEELSAHADLVFDAVKSPDPNPTRAVIAGLAKRFSETGKLGKIIHISGTFSFLTPASHGTVDEDKRKEFDDSKAEDLALIPRDRSNGPADHLILDAVAAGTVDGYIVCPAGIYGAFGSQLGGWIVPYFAYAQQKRALVYPGEGANQFELVHINDLIDLIFKIYDLAYTTFNPQRARYYIASVHRYTSKQLAELAAPALFHAGIVPSLEPKSIRVDEIGNSPADPFFAFVANGNMNTVANNAKMLEWEPKGLNWQDALEKEMIPVFKGE
ncbi:hypothetical protein DL96DRAFT_649849 [Flagelloscypha sp. PMI_526]|nr:hypothetical protein DL96DRAFT_649849 [Flagelloscypha sp. PMI_526]